MLTDLQMLTIAPFIDETIKNMEAMCGLSAHAGEPFLDQVENFRFKGYAVAAPTSGKINGVILLHNYIETALTIGNRLRQHMLEETGQHNEINEEMQVALAEWGNTIIGNATRFLSSQNLGIRFEPPYFITDTENLNSLLTHAREIISIPIHIAEGRFFFNYILNADNSVAGAGAGAIPREGKILIVDDSKFSRSVIKKYLKAIGHENTVEAANGRQAVEMHEKEKPDIIFMDYVMPEMSGFEALQRIRLADKKVPIVMCTSISDQNAMAECKALGVSGYILKPLTADEGPKKLQELLRNPRR